MKIVVLDGYTLNPGDLSWDELEKLGELIVYDRTPTDQIVERAEGAHVVLTNKTPLRADTLARLPKLTYIGVLATGYDVVDLKTAHKQGITVTNIPAYGTDSVAQFAIALLLELCHRIGHHSQSVKQGDWSRNADFCYWNHPLIELAGKAFGIVGAGRIGLQTARVASALGMNILAFSRSGPRETDIPGLRWVDQDELFRKSDVISLHCPLTNETEGMINKRSLKMMKNTALLLNTARGKLIDEEYLAKALDDGEIAGAAVDVLSTEPPAKDNPLLSAKNCIISPHIAWATREARSRCMQTTVNNVVQFLEGKPVNTVN